MFNEKYGEVTLEDESDDQEDILDTENKKNVEKILKNFYNSFSNAVVNENVILENLETLTSSKDFSKALSKNSFFDIFLDKLSNSSFEKNPLNFKTNA